MPGVATVVTAVPSEGAAAGAASAPSVPVGVRSPVESLLVDAGLPGPGPAPGLPGPIPAEAGGLAGSLGGLASPVPAAVAVLAIQAVVGLLFVRSAPGYAGRVTDRIRLVPGHAFVLGLLVVLGGGFLVVVRWAAATGTLALPVAGVYVGLVASGSTLGTIALGAALVDRVDAVLGGRLVGGLDGGRRVAASLGAGLLVSAGAHAVPAVGWAVIGLVSVLGVGAVAEWILDGHDADDPTVPDGRPYGPRL